VSPQRLLEIIISEAFVNSLFNHRCRRPTFKPYKERFEILLVSKPGATTFSKYLLLPKIVVDRIATGPFSKEQGPTQ
jgi:hypothetical protein